MLAGLFLCVTASAETHSGSCGPNATWTLDDAGKLTISGSGEIEEVAWEPDYSSDIKTVVIKNGITTIPEAAFRNCLNLKSISIPGSVTSIGEISFWNCKSLSSVTIPKSVTSIGNHAFNECTGLKTVNYQAETKNTDFAFLFLNCSGITAVNIPSDNTVYSSNDGIVFDKAGKTLLYYPCGKKGTYTVPSGITKIGVRAFCQGNLSGITIPGSVKEIGKEAFFFCQHLTSAIIPGSIKEIKENTFYNCDLTNLIISEGIKKIGYKAFSVNTSLKKVVLPNSLESIGEEAFFCTSLTQVTLHRNICSIGALAFDRTTAIYAPKDSYAVQWAQKNYYNYIETEPEYAVSVNYTEKEGTASASPASGAKGTKITLKASPKKGFLFSGWTVVSGGVKIEDNQFKIGEEDVVIKAKFKKDPSYALVKGAEYKLNTKNKTAVYLNPTSKTKTSITIPATVKVDGVKYQVTEIAANAFKGCSKLKKVTIGKNIVKIGKNAFKGCKKLATITIKTTKLTKKGIGSNSFKGIASKPTFKCPKKQKDNYKTWIVKTGKAPKKSRFK